MKLLLVIIKCADYIIFAVIFVRSMIKIIFLVMDYGGLTYYSTHSNKWDFYLVRASLNLIARVGKSPIYYCEDCIFKFILSFTF